MAQVIIRNLDSRVVEALRARAHVYGRSLEAELRLVLTRDAGVGTGIMHEPPAQYRPTLMQDKREANPAIRYPKEFRKLPAFKPYKAKGKLASRLLVEDRR